jgi:pilus assembly protein TadC
MERADHDGAAWGPGLDALAADVHRQRVSRLDEDGHRLTVGLLFPLVLCILPAFVLLALVPLIADTVRGIGL